MSEEILKALMQLFAIISKQDDGSTANQRVFVESFLSSQLNDHKVQEYLSLYDKKSLDESNRLKQSDKGNGARLTTVKDSVRTLSICRKINKTLTQKQKVIVLIRLYEMLMSEELFTEQRMAIISTIAVVFNISPEEQSLINNFIRNTDIENNVSEEILVIGNDSNEQTDPIDHEKPDTAIYILRVKSVDLYFIKYHGHNEVYLNGQLFNTSKIYLFPQGGTLRTQKGTIYYNDIVSRFRRPENTCRLSFKAENIGYKFQNNKTGLRNINIAEEFGLIGIMGASGSGKTTLLNVLSGIESPSEGKVILNGLDVHKDVKEAKGMIGYISQDDLLIEDLTVFENLYYNSKLCFGNLNDDQIKERVNTTLENLGLIEIKNLKVGNPLNKKISGGQRKRLNIALEIVREPSVLFVDEPTSGLSSRDSENVMDLLKELSLQMKLIFVVIHQPSSDIFKMLDKLILLDMGGYQIYYGNPVESLIYFKRETNQINSDIGECHACGSVNPELLFNIIESKEVDDLGHFTRQRIKAPEEWNEVFNEKFGIKEVEEISSIPPKKYYIPNCIKQLSIFIKRDLLSKIYNLQYVLISLIEAPLMAVFMTAIIKYVPDDRVNYIFRENENIPPYIFMSIVISLFIGLTVSAEEIFRDRKILKRESFLNLSRLSYIVSKVFILFSLSAVQMLIYILVGNTILEIKGLSFEYWSVLFAVSCFANILGLNISSALNSAVTIYILIPLLIIPQMALGGAMFNFDKINSSFGGTKGESPVIADFMASRWAYEALAVTQYRDNKYEKYFFEIEQIESQASYYQSFYIPELRDIVDESKSLLKNNDENSALKLENNLVLLRNEFGKIIPQHPGISEINISSLDPYSFNEKAGDDALDYLKSLDDKYIRVYNIIGKKKNELITSLENEYSGKGGYVSFRDRYYNDFLSDIVKKTTDKIKVIRDNNSLYQNFEPVYHDPLEAELCTLRAHFFAPNKYIAYKKVNALTFNLIVIWSMTIFLFVTLYFDLLKRIIDKFNGKKRVQRR